MDETSTKIMYELSKLTNKPKQITTDFIETITLIMFKEYINSIPNKDKYLEVVLDTWENQIITNKKAEIELLTDNRNSMFELVAGSAIANSENIEEFTKEVAFIKQLYKSSLLSE